MSKNWLHIATAQPGRAALGVQSVDKTQQPLRFVVICIARLCCGGCITSAQKLIVLAKIISIRNIQHSECMHTRTHTHAVCLFSNDSKQCTAILRLPPQVLGSTSQRMRLRRTATGSSQQGARIDARSLKRACATDVCGVCMCALVGLTVGNRQYRKFVDVLAPIYNMRSAMRSFLSITTRWPGVYGY